VRWQPWVSTSHTAKITTWAGRAEDAFYVTSRAGSGRNEKIPEDQLPEVSEQLRRELLQPFAAAAQELALP